MYSNISIIMVLYNSNPIYLYFYKTKIVLYNCLCVVLKDPSFKQSKMICDNDYQRSAPDYLYKRLIKYIYPKILIFTLAFLPQPLLFISYVNNVENN